MDGGTICGTVGKGGKNGGLVELEVGYCPAWGVVIGIVKTPVGSDGAVCGTGIKGAPTIGIVPSGGA